MDALGWTEIVNVSNSVEMKHPDVQQRNNYSSAKLKHEAVTPVASIVRKEVGVDFLAHGLSFYQSVKINQYFISLYIIEIIFYMRNSRHSSVLLQKLYGYTSSQINPVCRKK